MEEIQPNTDSFHFSDISLTCLAQQLLRHLWMIVAAALLFGVCAWFGGSLLYQPRYTGEMTCAALVRGGFSGGEETAGQMVVLLNSSVAVRQLREALPASAGTQWSMLAQPIANTNLIEITFSAPSERTATVLCETLETLLPQLSSYISGDLGLQMLRSEVSNQPINPWNPLKLCLLGALLGALGVCFVICRYSCARQTVQTLCGARRLLAGRILASLPNKRRGDVYAGQIMDICLQLEHSHGEDGAKVFLTAGVHTGEGVSTVALAVAKCLNERGRKTVLVECDLRKPSLVRNASAFLEDVLQKPKDSALLDQALHSFEGTSLQVISVKGGEKETTALLTGDAGAAMLQALCGRFDYVILDTPPMADYADAEAIARFADSAMVVIRQNKTPVKRIRGAAAALKNESCKQVHFVLNDMRGSRRLGDPHTVAALDLIYIACQCFRGLRKTWPILLSAAVLCGCLLGTAAWVRYSPLYECTVAASVSSGTPAAGDSGISETSLKMSKAFTQLVNTALMEDMLKQTLGVEEVEAQITASAIAYTNMVTVSVRGSSAELVYDTCNAVLQCYPQIAAYCAEDPVLLIRQAPVLPAAPANERSVLRASAVGALAGLLGMAACIYVYNLSCQPLYNAEQMEAVLQQPVVTVSLKGRKREESLKTLALRVEKLCQQTETAVLAVTGSCTGEGKTEVCGGLGTALAEAGHKVVIVDGNPIAPTVGTFFRGTQDGRGLAQCLEEPNVPVDACVKSVGSSRLMYLSGAPVSQWNGEAETLGQVLGKLKDHFDYVILDVPAMEVDAQAQLLLQLADCVLVVSRQDHTRAFELRETADRLNQRDISIQGGVFVKAYHA